MPALVSLLNQLNRALDDRAQSGGALSANEAALLEVVHARFKGFEVRGRIAPPPAPEAPEDPHPTICLPCAIEDDATVCVFGRSRVPDKGGIWCECKQQCAIKAPEIAATPEDPHPTLTAYAATVATKRCPECLHVNFHAPNCPRRIG